MHTSWPIFEDVWLEHSQRNLPDIFVDNFLFDVIGKGGRGCCCVGDVVDQWDQTGLGGNLAEVCKDLILRWLMIYTTSPTLSTTMPNNTKQRDTSNPLTQVPPLLKAMPSSPKQKSFEEPRRKG
jgi:hypothetical protein